MIDIDKLMESFCQLGAQAIERYFAISGEGPWQMPEFFMPAFIMDRLGDQTTATLETNFATLIQWNKEIRQRRGLAIVEHDDRLLQLAAQLRGRRVDLVFYEGQEIGKPKNEQDFYALVEFKGGWLDAEAVPGKVSDRDKLLMLMAHLDTCPWGIVCGWAPKVHREWQRDRVEGTGDKWFEKEILLPAGLHHSLFFCARLFANSPGNSRLEQLIDSIYVHPPASYETPADC